MGGGMGSMRGRGRQGDSAKMEGQRMPTQESLADQVEYRLDLLQEDLKLRPEQYNAWAAYSDRVKALAVDMTRERSRGMVVTTGTALQQIDRVADVARNRLTAIEDIIASARKLYDTLSPEQKLLADSRLATTLPPAMSGGPAAMAERPR
jgi:hypothetical protein